jgi:hypothetical protein
VFVPGLTEEEPDRSEGEQQDQDFLQESGDAEEEPRSQNSAFSPSPGEGGR